jgi:uncharacterized protein (DUF2141 family)
MMRAFSLLVGFVLLIKLGSLLSGCAQVMSPTGGAKDTLPPKLLVSTPPLRAINFTGNKITISFNEYIQLDNVSQNLLVSPVPKVNPYVDYKLKTVTIKLKDTLQPNTTYSINLGNSIKDLNEGNIYKNFTYVFSTGPYIDSMTLSGKVILAETGGVDTLIQAYLYKELSDTAVQKKKPNYIARLDREGKFTFNNLPPGTYKLYALKDGDGSRTYNSALETFAFADNNILVSPNPQSVTLYAYAEEKEKPKAGPSLTGGKKGKGDKNIRYSTVVGSGQDLLSDLILEFASPLKNLDKTKIRLTDTAYKNYNNVQVKLDSTQKKLIISTTWTENSFYKLIIDKSFATDTSGATLVKTDTISFITRKETDYGSIKLHFTKLDITKNPVLQFIYNNELVNSYPLSSSDWSVKLFKPGEYEMRILYDENKNGKWDPGNYHEKKQPEKVYSIPQKITIKANWDNEKDIQL